MVGQTLSHYRIIEKIGQGGMGKGLQGGDTRLGRYVALKFLPEKFAENRQALAQFPLNNNLSPRGFPCILKRILLPIIVLNHLRNNLITVL